MAFFKKITDSKLGVEVKPGTRRLILDTIKDLEEYDDSASEDIDDKIIYVKYVLDRIGIEKKPSTNMIKDVYRFCNKDGIQWKKTKIDLVLEPFVFLEKMIYTRNIRESSKSKQNMDEVFFKYFMDYLTLIEEILKEKDGLNEQEFNEIYNAVLGSGLPIDETINVWKILKKEGKTDLLFHTIIRTASLTLDSTPMDVYNVYENTQLEKKGKKVKVRETNTAVMEALNNVKGVYESRVRAAIEEEESKYNNDETEKDKKNGKRKIDTYKIKSDVRKKFIEEWTENPQIIDGKYIFVDELNAYFPLEYVFNENIKIKRGVFIEDVGVRGFGKNEKDFLAFCEALEKVVKKYDSEKMYGDIYQILAEYRFDRVDDGNVLSFQERYYEKVRGTERKKFLKRFAPVVAALLIGITGGEVHGRLAEHNQRTETTMEDDSKIPDSSSNNNGVSGELPQEIIDTINRIRDKQGDGQDISDQQDGEAEITDEAIIQSEEVQPEDTYVDEENENEYDDGEDFEETYGEDYGDEEHEEEYRDDEYEEDGENEQVSYKSKKGLSVRDKYKVPNVRKAIVKTEKKHVKPINKKDIKDTEDEHSI